MAKELPYFKFEPSEWQNGNIQMCSFEAQIVFINLCCSYWQRLGELPYAFALQKHCNGINNALQELIKNDVITIKEDNISIDFLNEQLKERFEKSTKASESAKKRWSKTGNANASKTQSERNAKREEKKREEKSIIPTLETFVAHAVKRKPNVCTKDVELKYYAWIDNEWSINRKGVKQPIKNWKSSLTNTIKYLNERYKDVQPPIEETIEERIKRLNNEAKAGG